MHAYLHAVRSGIVIHVHVLSSANVCLSNTVSNIPKKPGNQMFCISHVFILHNC